MEVQGSPEEGRYLSRDQIREQDAGTGQVIRGTAFPAGEQRFRQGNSVSGRGTAFPAGEQRVRRPEPVSGRPW